MTSNLLFVAAMQETRKVKYGSAVNLQNGMVQIEFIEDGDSGTKGGEDQERHGPAGDLRDSGVSHER